ncbi:MAG: hypothetical protein AAF221_08325 [Pseudomonadota bacterium]
MTHQLALLLFSIVSMLIAGVGIGGLVMVLLCQTIQNIISFAARGSSDPRADLRDGQETRAKNPGSAVSPPSGATGEADPPATKIPVLEKGHHFASGEIMTPSS